VGQHYRCDDHNRDWAEAFQIFLPRQADNTPIDTAKVKGDISEGEMRDRDHQVLSPPLVHWRSS
jgi:hypothetical protein